MNHMPDEKQIEELFERAVPGTTGRLEKRLASAPWTQRAVNRRRSIQATVFAVIMVTLIVAVTPQGYAIAQDVLQFFTRTESDSYYEPVSDLTFEETTPFHKECGIPIRPTCSVEQIRSMVDFEVKELGILPDGLFYVGATGGPDSISLNYEYPVRATGGIGILVEPTGNPAPDGKHLTAKSANIEKVEVEGLPAEYYTGSLFQDENGNVTWQPDMPVAQLRWADGGSTYTLYYFFHDREDVFTKEELIEIAESMTTEPVDK